MQFQDAAKYVTETNQPAIFIIVEVNLKWYESLPKDLQQIVDQAAARETVAINQGAADFVDKMRKTWVERGGEIISLPPDEQSAMMKMLASVGVDVSKSKPHLSAAYKVLVDAAARAQ
jgi:TRAP-type C4-dicarboxylate transport system substrate-binding protein